MNTPQDNPRYSRRLRISHRRTSRYSMVKAAVFERSPWLQCKFVCRMNNLPLHRLCTRVCHPTHMRRSMGHRTRSARGTARFLYSSNQSILRPTCPPSTPTTSPMSNRQALQARWIRPSFRSNWSILGYRRRRMNCYRYDLSHSLENQRRCCSRIGREEARRFALSWLFPIAGDLVACGRTVARRIHDAEHPVDDRHPQHREVGGLLERRRKTMTRTGDDVALISVWTLWIARDYATVDLARCDVPRCREPGRLALIAEVAELGAEREIVRAVVHRGAQRDAFTLAFSKTLVVAPVVRLVERRRLAGVAGGRVCAGVAGSAGSACARIERSLGAAGTGRASRSVIPSRAGRRCSIAGSALGISMARASSVGCGIAVDDDVAAEEREGECYDLCLHGVYVAVREESIPAARTVAQNGPGPKSSDLDLAGVGSGVCAPAGSDPQHVRGRRLSRTRLATATNVASAESRCRASRSWPGSRIPCAANARESLHVRIGDATAGSQARK